MKSEMKNRILSITRNTIPYVKELRIKKIAPSVTAAILMQQLDYWFERYPDKFYKFLEPCSHDLYSEGDSWTEELGFSKDEFRAAFAQIGTHYKSKSQFTSASDKFKGNYYCSYHDRVKGVVYYFRNHKLVDHVLDQLLEPGTIDRNGKAAKPISRDRQGRFTENGKPDLHSITETITETTPEINSNGDKPEKISGHSFASNALEKKNRHEQEQLTEPSQSNGKTRIKDSEPKPLSVVGGTRIKDPQTPQSRDTPLSPALRKLRLQYDDNGILQFPATGKHKLAGQLALRSTQIAIACRHLEVELGKDADGRYYGCDPYFGEWVEEDEIFGKYLPFTKVVRVVLCEQHYVSASEINDEMVRWFEYWSGCLKTATLPRGKRVSVIPVVASTEGVEIDLVDDEEDEYAIAF